MKRRTIKNNGFMSKGIMASLVISVFLLSIGYSALNQELKIGAIAIVEPEPLIKISSVIVDSSSEDNSMINSVSNNDETIISNITLDDESSWVKYRVEITNIGNEEMGILRIVDNLLPNNIQYEFDNYSIGDVLCDDIDSTKCTLNSSTTLFLTIKYKDNEVVSNPYTFDANLEMEFERINTVTYNDNVCTSVCPSKIINDGTLTVTLDNYILLSVYKDDLLLIKDTSYFFDSNTGVLTIPNVDGNIRISSTTYTRLNYIQSTGVAEKQFIDTLYVPNENTYIEYDGMVVDGDTALFGVRASTSGTNQRRFTFQFISANIYRTSYKNNDYLANASYEKNNRYLFKMDVNSSSINNHVINTYGDNQTFLASGNLYLFGINTAGNMTNPGIVRLYSFKIYENNELKKNFIPAFDSDNVACLYETIEKKFYYNGGDGAFDYGEITYYSVTNNIENVFFSNQQTQYVYGDEYTTYLTSMTGNSIPTGLRITSNQNVLLYGSDYEYNAATGFLKIHEIKGNIVIYEQGVQELEYMSSTGIQYINTRYSPTINTKVELTNIPINSASKSWTAYFGTKDKTGDGNSFYFSTGASRISAWVGGVHVSGTSDSFLHNVGSTQVITVTSNSLKIEENGEEVFYNNVNGTPVFTNAREIYIFGRNAGDTFNYPSSINLKSFRIYENNILVRNFIPRIDLNGEYALYETLSGEYYYNQGTGSFSGE